jgi:chromosome segregation ATPase
LDAKTSDANERVREIGRLTNKLLDQDEEISSLKNSVTDKDYDLQLQRVKMKDFESTLIQKNITITKLEKEIESIKHLKFTNE